jgi:OmpA-OmpF porin, OOP family
MALTAKGKKTISRFIGLVVIICGVFGLKYAAGTGLGQKYLPAFMVPKVKLDDQVTDSRFNTSGESNVAFAGLPTTKVANLSNVPVVRVKFWAWNAQMGCLLANGGPVTTQGSLMEKQDIKMFIERQDDNNQLMAELTTLAKSMKDGNTDPTEGSHYIAIMGDGSGAFLSALNTTLVDAYGEDYRAEIIGSCGYSRGEDKLMGPEKWATNPKTLKGALVAGVLRDGDWNIAVRFAGDNDVGVNPDEKTYDPNLLNFMNTSTYIDAAQKFVAGACEDRKVVNNGKPTGETKNVCVEGAVTWTPGDVIMAKERCRGEDVGRIHTRWRSGNQSSPSVGSGRRNFGSDL